MNATEPSGRGAAARRSARAGGAGAAGASSPPTSTRRSPTPTSSTPGSDGGSARPSARASSAATVRRELDPDALAALEEERDFLLRSLDDLEREHDAGDVDDTDYAGLKDDYTARAAEVLRAIDDRRVLASSTASNRSWVRTALGLGLVAVVALGVGWFVLRDAGTRAPGGGITGDARQDSANLVLEAQGFTGQAQQALQQGDSPGALDLYRKALESYSKALEIAPNDGQALTFRGWLYHNLAVGVGDGTDAVQLDGYARQDLDAAVAADASFTVARVFRAVLEADAGDYPAARADLDAADPSDIPDYMRSTLDDLTTRVAAGLAGTATTTP